MRTLNDACPKCGQMSNDDDVSYDGQHQRLSDFPNEHGNYDVLEQADRFRVECANCGHVYRAVKPD